MEAAGMWTARRTFAALVVLAAALGPAAAAQAAPDWTAPAGLPSDAQPWLLASSLGFADDGTALGAHVDLVSPAPLDTALSVSHRRAGEDWAGELTIDEPGAQPLDVKLAVAPNGAAVLVWIASTGPTPYAGPFRYRAAFRAPDGAWGAPVTLADQPHDASNSAMIEAAIGADGSAAAGVIVDEPSWPGEPQPDTNAIVAVHPAGGDWTAPQPITPGNASAQQLSLAFDDTGQLTGVWRQRYSEGATADSNDDDWGVVTRRRSPSNGVWSGADDLTSSDGYGIMPLLAVGPDGRAVIAWHWFGKTADPTSDVWASTRASAAGAWSAPERIVHAVSVQPLAAGIGPDGTTYVEYATHANQASDSAIGVVGRPAGGGWGVPAPLRSNVSSAAAGGIAFTGGDVVFAWESVDNGTYDARIQAARWRAGAPAPDFPRDLDQPNSATALAGLESDRRGGIVAQWKAPHPRLTVLDGGGPELTASSVPGSTAVGQPLGVSATFADMWSAVPAAPTWDFGDGSAPAVGAAVSHTYAQAGTYTITARAADALGNKTTKTFGVTVAPAAAPATAPEPPAGSDAAKPTVTLRLPRCGRRDTKRSCARRRHTTAAWRVLRGAVHDPTPSSGIARVEVAITRLRDGRGTAATRFRPASVTGTSWSRRAGRLRRGAYVFRVRAVDRAGNTSATVTRRLRLR